MRLLPRIINLAIMPLFFERGVSSRRINWWASGVSHSVEVISARPRVYYSKVPLNLVYYSETHTLGGISQMKAHNVVKTEQLYDE
jgi:hypothetical protein